MTIKPIKTDKDYNEALERLEVIFDAVKGTPESDEPEILGILISQYENDHFPIGLPDPVEAINSEWSKWAITKMTCGIVGQKSRASEILNRKRKLSLDMIPSLHEKLHIPTDVLIQMYSL